MSKISGIYKIQSISHPERFYIGSGQDLEKRWQQHSTKLNTRCHNPKLQNHYNKYGKDDLVFIIIEPCLPQFLVIREQYYIDVLNPFFNIRKIADSNLGISHPVSEETKKKISNSMKGIKRTKEHQDKLNLSAKGRPSKLKGRKAGPLSLQHCIKIGESKRGNKNMLGKHHSEESRKKISEARKNQIFSPEVIKRRGESIKKAWDRRKLKNIA